MKLIKVGAAVLNQTPFAWEHNRANILRTIAEARAQGVSILCLPELAITGYGCEDAFHSPGLHRTAWKMLKEIEPETKGIVVCLGIPVLYHNGLFDAAALVCDGRILGIAAKRFLAGDGIHYEPRWFKPWPPGLQADFVIDGETIPLGDVHFEIGGVRIGFEICEDAWVAARPGGAMALKGVDLILNPSGSHFAFDKIEVRKRFVLEGSRAFGVSYLYANLLGNESGRAIYDGGALIASAGKMLAAGPRFSFADFNLTVATIDIDATRMNQARTASFKPSLEEGAPDCIRADFPFPRLSPRPDAPLPETWESSPHRKEEEFSRSVALALFDYLRKARLEGFVISISGGADSAACACLVALMVRIGVAELGLEGFTGKLSYLPRLKGAKSPAEIVHELLACVYQATENSSLTTREAARSVAGGIGAQFFEFNIDRLVKEYVDIVSRAVGRELTWEHDDIPLQNIQARVRAPGVWLLGNLQNKLLLSTSNRSEAAVGYATMDGDTCGGLSPVAGIDKAFLRLWLRWLQEQGPYGIGPIPSLAAVTSLAPMAELRPPSAHQTDEADLMPYDVLDAIERAAIRDKQSPLEILSIMAMEFPQFTRDRMAQWIERFFRLWCRNQWKRERYAPSFHVDDENLDPKTWCRFPILSGGYEYELAEMRSRKDEE